MFANKYDGFIKFVGKYTHNISGARWAIKGGTMPDFEYVDVGLNTLITVAKYNNRSVIKKERDNNMALGNKGVCMLAIRGGHFELYLWLCNEYSVEYHMSAKMVAVKHGCLRCFQML